MGAIFPSALLGFVCLSQKYRSRVRCLASANACVSAFWVDCSSPAKRAIATFQVFGSLVLFAAAAAAGGAPAEAVLAASGSACGSLSTRASPRAAKYLARASPHLLEIASERRAEKS